MGVFRLCGLTPASGKGRLSNRCRECLDDKNVEREYTPAMNAPTEVTRNRFQELDYVAADISPALEIPKDFFKRFLQESVHGSPVRAAPPHTSSFSLTAII